MNAHVITENEIPHNDHTLVLDSDEKVQKNVLESLLNVLPIPAGPNRSGLEEFAAILALSDESFEVLAPKILETTREAFNDVSTKAQISSVLIAEGFKIEDLAESLPHIFEALDRDLKGTVSPIKIDFLKELFSITVNSLSDTIALPKRTIQIPIELCNENAKIPTYANPGDAGFDVYALEDITVLPGETVLVPTGIKVAIPKGYEIQVRPKSGRALKTKLRVANTPGTVDSQYRDELKVIIENVEPPIKDITYTFNADGEIKIDSILHGSPFTIGKGEKFAQLVLNEVATANFYQVEDISIVGGNRGGGFGSSGLK